MTTRKQFDEYCERQGIEYIITADSEGRQFTAYAPDGKVFDATRCASNCGMYVPKGIRVDWSYAIYEYELVDDVEETDNENNINV
tara:strand:- start:159 stop:413 length:255 start_codon:yes stop_codon:yes gene_type:complete